MLKPYQSDINDLIEADLFKGKPAQVGEVRNWSGKSFVKQADGQWVPVASEKDHKPVEQKPVHHQADSKGQSAGVDEHELAALKEYQSGMYQSAIGGYANIQSYLRTGKPKYGQFTDADKAMAEDVAKHVSSAIQKHPLDKPMKVYRGMKISKDDPSTAQYKDLKVGDTVVDRGFTSTSTSDKVGGKFSEKLNRSDVSVQIEISLKPGDHALPMDQYHKHESEKEVLLDRNVKFKVTSVSERAGVKKIKLEIQS